VAFFRHDVIGRELDKGAEQRCACHGDPPEAARQDGQLGHMMLSKQRYRRH
jgi:hypothetical protein